MALFEHLPKKSRFDKKQGQRVLRAILFWFWQHLHTRREDACSNHDTTMSYFSSQFMVVGKVENSLLEGVAHGTYELCALRIRRVGSLPWDSIRSHTGDHKELICHSRTAITCTYIHTYIVECCVLGNNFNYACHSKRFILHIKWLQTNQNLSFDDGSDGALNWDSQILGYQQLLKFLARNLL